MIPGYGKHMEYNVTFSDATSAMHDTFGRHLHYLRVSLTDACNLRCVYCMPEDITFRPAATLLQDDETRRWPRRPGLDDEMAEIGKADRAFVLHPLPRRDEGPIRGIVLHGLDEVEVRHHGRAQPQQRARAHWCTLRPAAGPAERE